MSNPAFLTDGSGIAPHIPLAKVRKVGLGGETAHVGYFLPIAGCLPLIFCLALYFCKKNAEKSA